MTPRLVIDQCPLPPPDILLIGKIQPLNFLGLNDYHSEILAGNRIMKISDLLPQS
jgi:hypothetical protein